MPTPIQGIGGLSWNDVVTNLKTKGALNKQYDSDVDGVLDWFALRFPGVRQEVLQYFDDPKILIATSSMLEVLNSADKVEAASGNISATSQELTIIGGSATASGRSWIYWNLPNTAKKIYVRAFLADESGGNTGIFITDADASTDANPPNQYVVYIATAANTADFNVSKNINGIITTLYTEAVDLVSLQYYLVEIYFETDGAGNQHIEVWRDGVLKTTIDDSDTGYGLIYGVKIRKYDTSTTKALVGKVKGYVVIIYE